MIKVRESNCCGKCTDYWDVYGPGAEKLAEVDGHCIAGMISCSECECHAKTS